MNRRELLAGLVAVALAPACAAPFVPGSAYAGLTDADAALIKELLRYAQEMEEAMSKKGGLTDLMKLYQGGDD